MVTVREHARLPAGRLRYRCAVSSDPPHVSLEPLAMDDVPALLDINIRNREDIDRVSPSDVDAYSDASMRARVENLLANGARGERVSWTIRVGGVVAGDVGLSHIQRGALQRANLGYMVDSAFRGRGVATAAARLASQLAFSDVGLHRVEAGTMPSNVGSQRVLEKAGFTRVGLQRSFLLIAGRWEDHYLYELVGPDTPPAGGG
jgi:ribosomal-protein-alanine N-acetyltransferase